MKQITSIIEQNLTLDMVLGWLVNDQLISAEEEQAINQYSIRWENRDKEINTIICDYQTESEASLAKTFTQEKLDEWLAAKVALPFFLY